MRFTADAGWFSVCLTGAAEDRLLRGLRDRDRFLAVAAALPPIRDWIDPAVASAVGSVLPMANILSRRRHTVRNGVPCATGLVSVGDAVACNNPMLGRGLALALRHAQHLRDTLRDVPADNVDLPVDYDGRIAPEVDAWYTDTVGWDRSRLTALAEARATATRGPDPRALFLSAARHDAVLHRAFLRTLHTYEPAQQVFTDPALIARVTELAPHLPPAPPDPLDRNALEQLLLPA